MDPREAVGICGACGAALIGFESTVEFVDEAADPLVMACPFRGGATASGCGAAAGTCPLKTACTASSCGTAAATAFTSSPETDREMPTGGRNWKAVGTSAALVVSSGAGWRKALGGCVGWAGTGYASTLLARRTRASIWKVVMSSSSLSYRTRASIGKVVMSSKSDVSTISLFIAHIHSLK